MTAKKRTPSALYRHIEDLQGNQPWGSLLDAGTGINSLPWVLSLPTDKWTAVTGSPGEAKMVRDVAAGKMRAQDQIILGNWAEQSLLEGASFDTVIADYLLGAVEGFAPYFQPYLFARLRPLVKGRLYMTGLEPYVPGDKPDDPAAKIIWEIGRFRDSCLLLKGAMPYREYPAPWAADHMQRAGYTVKSIKHFTIKYKETFVNSQIDIALNGIHSVANEGLASALAERGEEIRAKATAMVAQEGALKCGRSYVIASSLTPA